MAAAAPSAVAGGSAPQPSLGTLQVILSSDVLLKAFEEFARKERNEENLILLAKIADFKRSDVPGRTTRTAEIAKMIKSGTVNASAKTRASLDSSVAKLRGWETMGTAPDSPDVTRELESVEATLLLLETTVHRELVGDALPRFLRSPQYAAASAEVAATAKPRRESLARGLLKSLGSSMKALAPATPAAGGPGAASGAGSAPSPSALQTPLPFLSLGGVSERKQALLDLLSHSAACSVFVEFCRREHNDENVECLLDLQALRRLDSPDARRRKAREVLDTYIKGGSAKEANVDSRTRAAAELWLARCAASGAALDSAELADAVSESWEVGGTLLGASATGGTGSGGASPDPLGKVELELINMLSGEVLPRFVASRMWTDFVSSYPGGQYRAPGGAGGVSLPGASLALAQSLSIASIGEPGGDGAGSSAAAAATSGASEKSGGGGFFGFRRKDKDKDKAAATAAAAGAAAGGAAEGSGASASAAAAHKLRDKIYLFGVSLKPRLFGSKKASELEVAGSAIKGAEIKAGFLLKRAHHKASWKRRWFVLSPFALAYYDTNTAAAPNGVILTSEITAVSAWWDPTLCKGAPPGTSGTGGGAAAAAAAAATAAGSGSGGAGGGSGGAGSGTRPTSTRAGDGSSVDVLGAHAVPPPPDVSSLSSAFFVYTAHRPYTFQAANDRDRLRWLYALDHARRGDVDAVKAAERTGYAGLEGSTLAAWLLSRAQTYAPPPPGAGGDGEGEDGFAGEDGPGEGAGDADGDGEADESLLLALDGSDDDAASAGGGSAPGSARSRPQSLGSPLRPHSVPLPAGSGGGSGSGSGSSGGSGSAAASGAGSGSGAARSTGASGFSDAETDGGGAADSSRASVRRPGGSGLSSTADEGEGASAPGGSGFADGKP